MTIIDQDKDTARNKADPFDLTRIGAQDIAFTDNVLNQSYRYEAIFPYYKHELPKRCHTLKDWSARKLVEALFSNQNDELKSSESNRWLSYLIDTCPVSNSWTIWKRVWHYILLSERDTPAVFSIFLLEVWLELIVLLSPYSFVKSTHISTKYE